MRLVDRSGCGSHEFSSDHAEAEVEPSSRIWELMAKHAKVYVSPDAELPVPDRSEPGFIVRYSITRIGGIGPWAQALWPDRP